ncbi:cadmium-translocating P-type ATPase [Alishewanella sp. 16-MA]|uniref:Cadmium-translocating P-type ATPase n=1 Tax=Alishewanella maricola TaxID=2795740 RepID=A0ABS8C421_9ALTE|nr:heavy metal translocating P-type ATPase [Alishewanella maricola]MCB5226890.1 cadmium-translocating P-type ATPase [Alishewanella maricola]
MAVAAVRCFHCHETVHTGDRFTLNVDGQEHYFCCAGCQAVADTIFSNGLADYYRFRTAAATKIDALPLELSAELSQFDNEAVLADISQQHNELTDIELSISGMSCAACAWLIEKQLRKLPQLHSVSINASTQRALLRFDSKQLSLSAILQRITDIGYQASPFVADQEEQKFKLELNRYLKRLAVSGILTMQVMMLAFALYFGEYTGIETAHEGYLRWISLLLTIPVVLYAAKPFVVSAWRSIKARQMNMDVPVTLALYYTFFASAYATAMQTGEVYFESVCMFTFLLQLGKFFEFRARAQAREATSNLLKIMPVTATLHTEQGPQPTSARRLQTGDIILVKAGETLPADGIVKDGQSSVDESMLTGEYRAISKTIGDTVLAGSVNHDGLLQVQVSRVLAHSRLGQIIQLQQLTLSQKPKLVEKTDQLAKYFVERLLVIALLTFLLWYFWWDPSRAFWVTLSVLVATCPCALSLATPTAITCALARLNRQGVLIKNAQVLEVLPNISHIVVDKTGTLTEGKFSLQQVHRVNPALAETDLLNLVANLEQYSEHPIARAFAPYLTQPLTLNDVQVAIGAGIRARWQGQQLKVGSAQFCGVPAEPEWQVYFTLDNQLQAKLQLVDKLREEATALIQQLQQQGYKLGMLTGDHSVQAEQLTAALKLDFMHKGCSPEDKVTEIQQLIATGAKVLMLGDGINDSPSFNAAHISVAVQSGTDLSKNQADVVFLKADLRLLQNLLQGGKQTARVIKQNLGWSVGYNLVIIPLAVAGFVSPYIAVIGMSFSSLLVVSNSLRLLKK